MAVPTAPASQEEHPSSVAMLSCSPSMTGPFLLYLTGLDAGTGQHEVTLEVPHPSHSRATPPASPSPCTDPAAQEPSEGEESPVVQSDEEGVEVDTALATLHTDDSDS